MRIYIDITHPVFFHFIRHLLKIMEQHNHDFFITAKDKDVVIPLMNYYNVSYTNRGKPSNTYLGKALNIIKSDFTTWRQVRKFDPDLVLCFSSPVAAHTAFLLKKPCIAFEDTECAGLVHKSYLPFADVVITPSCFTKNFGEKQIAISSYKELGYLYPKYFAPNKSIYESLGVGANEKYVIVRFVSHHALHDKGVSWLSEKDKINLVNKLLSFSKVFISSEEPLPPVLEAYRLQTLPWELHSVLANASLLMGESGTMAAEAAMLGVPAIFIDEQGRGYTTELEEKYGLVYNYKPTREGFNNSLNKAVDILKNQNLKNEFLVRKEKMLFDKIDIASFLVWFIENYPQSVETLLSNPKFQYNFK